MTKREEPKRDREPEALVLTAPSVDVCWIGAGLWKQGKSEEFFRHLRFCRHCEDGINTAEWD